MKRRTFFGSAAAAGLAGAVPVPDSGKVKPGDIPKRKFGKTGEALTIIGPAGGRFHLAGFEDAKAITQRAYDLGINYFDNARLYWGGRSEEVYGEVLAPVRKKVFITSKCHLYTKAAAEKCLNESLKAMKTDYLDLWQIHQVSEMSEVEQIFAPGGSIEAFEAAKKAGKVRFIGFTGHHDPAVHLEMLKRYDKYDTILMPLNPADPGYLSFEKQVLPIAVERGMAIQGMKSTANAKLLQTLSVRECISYALSLPIHTLALGCTTIGQIEDDVRIAREFKPLTGTEQAQLRSRVDKLKGPGLEDWKRNSQQAAVAPKYRDGMHS
jgi:predicted aldo/keto reductase-like oxidoreductase